MEKTSVAMIDGPLLVDGQLYTGKAFGINTGAINAVICAETNEELIWLFEKILPGQTLALGGIKSVVIGQKNKATKVDEAT